MESYDREILLDKLIPRPRRAEFTEGEDFILADNCPVQILVDAPAGVKEKTVSWFREFWQITPELQIEKGASALSGEAYRLSVCKDKISIAAADITGVMNCLKTMRQLAMAIRGTAVLQGYFIIPCEIDDAPAMPFRGIHLCIFPETPLWDIEKQLRLAAYHKFNYAVIECWGIFRFDSHPELCWPDNQLDKADLKRLIRLGRELGITLVPQFNLLGHATASRVISAKHAVLDLNPALQPLFEDHGWSWCLSNPAVRPILTDIVLELYDFFEEPGYFHIGCDEAYDLASCRSCRKHAAQDLVAGHIIYFRDLFAARNARVIMWHDMLINRDDPRWKGYIALGEKEQQLEKLYQLLPRDIIIADWQYGYKAEPEDPEPEWATARFFKDEKFDVMVCPWRCEEGIRSLGKFAAEEKLFGMLATTWHTFHAQYLNMIQAVAPSAAWNPVDVPAYRRGNMLAVAYHLRQIGWDMKITSYEQTGSVQYQVAPGTHPHNEF